MHLHLLQHTIQWQDRAATVAHVRAVLKAAPPRPGSLLVLPEMFATGFSMNVDQTAETPLGQSIRYLARDFSCAVLAGTTGRNAAGRGLNIALAYDPDGAQLCSYTKLHPFSFGAENRHFSAGSELACFEWAGLRITPLICYDLRFPEAFRAALRLHRPQLFCVIANWPAQRRAHWNALLPARAIENQAYVAGVNRTGPAPGISYKGDSQILSFQGTALARAGAEETLLSAELDAARVEDWRAEFSALTDMRRDLN